MKLQKKTSVFFALEVELWKIGDSEPAPKFNIVSRPNNWSKNLREVAHGNTSGEVSALKLQQLKYWENFREFLLERGGPIRPQKGLPQHWMNLSIGRSGFWMNATVNSRKNKIGTSVAFKTVGTKALYEYFYKMKDQIEKEFGRELTWWELPDAKESAISTYLENTDFRDDDLPPTSRTSIKFVKSVNQENDGHEEEQIYRRADHWLSEAGRGRHPDQGGLPQWRVQ